MVLELTQEWYTIKQKIAVPVMDLQKASQSTQPLWKIISASLFENLSFPRRRETPYYHVESKADV